jgi:hypothetical protein
LAYLDKVGHAVTERVNVPGAQMRNLGKWVVNWTTGRWIQVVGQWEMTSWDWFIEHFTKTNLMFDHPEGQEQYRSGGFEDVARHSYSKKPLECRLVLHRPTSNR